MGTFSEFEVLHAEPKEIFFDALEACDIASSFDRRIRFQGAVLHRLAVDGASLSTIDMNSFKQVFVVARGKAAGPMLDVLLDRMRRRTSGG